MFPCAPKLRWKQHTGILHLWVQQSTVLLVYAALKLPPKVMTSVIFGTRRDSKYRDVPSLPDKYCRTLMHTY